MNIKDLDRRLERSTGVYDTREELVRAIKHKAYKGKMSHERIGEEVGMSRATVTRILSGDEPAYVPAIKNVEELPSNKLNKFWRIPG